MGSIGQGEGTKTIRGARNRGASYPLEVLGKERKEGMIETGGE